MNSDDDFESLHDRSPTERFSDRVVDYARFRPTYPSTAIDAVLEGLGDPARRVAADVGAGTGISSRLLADRGVRVIAVEPNAAMRAAIDRHPLIEPREGRAEATTLPPSSVDVVVCAQSFHWFEPDATLAEFHRILRPSGRLALLWNDRDDREPATAEYARLIRAASDDDPAARLVVHRKALFRCPLFVDVRLAEFPSGQRLDAAGLVGRAASASYVPRSGPARDRLERELRAMPERFADADGLVRISYVTRVYTATRAPTARGPRPAS